MGKKRKRTFLAGMATAMLVLTLGLFTWAALLIIEVQPAVKVSKQAKVTKKYTKAERAKMVSSLKKLYHLCKFLGLREYSSLAIGSAGYITSMDRSRASTMKAKYYFLQAIEEAEYVVRHPPSKLLKSLDPMDPLLEAYFHYSMFLHNHCRYNTPRHVLSTDCSPRFP